MSSSLSSRRAFLAASGATVAASPFPIRAQESSSVATLSTLVITSSFAQGSDGWLPVFTDYNLATTGFDFLAEVRSLPKSVEVPDAFRQAYYLQSHNRSDDVFMFLKKVLTRDEVVVENAAYRLSFDIWLASNANDCFGSGGNPGASVYLKERRQHHRTGSAAAAEWLFVSYYRQGQSERERPRDGRGRKYRQWRPL